MSAWSNSSNWGHPVAGAAAPSVAATPASFAGYGDPFVRPQMAGPQVAALGSDAKVNRLLSTKASAELASGYYKGGGGYTYLWDAPSATITIAAGPTGAGSQLSPGHTYYNAVLTELYRIGAPNTSSPTGSAGSSAAAAAADASGAGGISGGSRFANIVSGLSQAATTAAALTSQVAAAKAAQAATAAPAVAAPAQMAPATPSRLPWILAAVGGTVVLGLIFATLRKRR
jgi:hypothetical protein